ncbi:MAG: hypothetical protein A2166_05480 [Omnitrophica WOR_2 bacterium RBG_13_41_10]|nr:MAG: hypothetical protein A2166_05480 [Omnitrophica WOR_2 bacterium RBG_13_41_10]
MKKLIFCIMVISFILFFNHAAIFAQIAVEVEKAESDIREEKALREKIEKKVKKPQIEEKEMPKVTPAVSEEKALIKKINVTGVTLLKEKEINNIISGYTNKELTLTEMQKVADMITDIYRQKGYITSRAYLPPQKITTGVLEIRIMEGITGDFDIKGNRYFKKSLYRNKIVLKKGEPFNYEILRKGLSKINELPDRSVKAVVAPGKTAGTTDVALEAKDRLPMHIGFDWDNYGSRFIDKQRFRTTLTHNNLLGLDDVFVFQYQLAKAEDYTLLSGRYLLPLTENLKLGFFAAKTKLKLGKDYEDLGVRGKSTLYSIYASQTLINRENIDLLLSVGFDYKDVFNFQTGVDTSRDRMRVAKLNLDMDITDGWGRTIITNEVNLGIPNIMGGLKAKDPQASVSGACGRFFKDNVNLVRLQRLPWDATLLWKNQLQFSPNLLTATEQFQIGGIVNVRAYPPAEVVGDSGYSMTWELSLPIYMVPRDLKVPFSKAKVYDALRLVAFYDWANARQRRPAAGVQKNRTLRGAGWGLRFNLPEDFSARVEFAWPLDNMPSDSERLHTLFEISKSF